VEPGAMHYSNLPHEAIDLAAYGTMVGRLGKQA
jgi:hypothetical protein